MRVAISGHRPEKIPDFKVVEDALLHAYKELRATHVIQGMAAGVDLVSAKVAHHANIPFTCARPWSTHKGRMGGSSGYNESWERDYDFALRLADKVVDVDPADHYPGPWVYQKRNEWMVDHAEAVIAVWNGTSGGTANCVNYALAKTKPIWRIDPATGEGNWYASQTI